MEIKYDRDIDVKYINIKKGKVLKTCEKFKDVLFDYGKNDEILGVEILNASKNLVNVCEVGGEFSSLKKITKKKVDTPHAKVLGVNEYDQVNSLGVCRV